MTSGPSGPQRGFLPAKKPRPARDWTFWERLWGKISKPAIGFVSLGLFITAAWLVTEVTRFQTTLVQFSPDEAERLRLLSLEKEEMFEKLRVNKPVLEEADITYLAEAVQAQEDHLASRRALASDNVRLETIRRRYHVIQAERLRAVAVEAEALATMLTKTNNPGAIEALQRAVEAERLIENRWFFSGYSNVGKIAQLFTRLRRLEAQPFWEKTRAEETSAETLFARGQIDEAAAQLGVAIETEQGFNEKYRDVLDSEFGRLERLTQRQETMRSHRLYLRIKGLEDAAQTTKARLESASPSAQPAGQLAMSAAYGQAYDLQVQLMQEFPRSAWATIARRDEFEYLRNRWRLAPLLTQLSQQTQQIAQHLREGKSAEAEIMASTLLRELQGLEKANPGVILPSDPLRRELEYIATHAATIRAILPKLNQLLNPVPGTKVRMLKQEISQGFYTTVIGANPSAVVRENLPVESVTYAEVSAFCEALGWMCGRRVRLPTIAEYTATLGDLSRPPAAKEAWTFDTTDGGTLRPVGLSSPNAAGFFDLLGNAEEWALDESKDGPGEMGTVVGGSVNWVPVPGLPLRKAFKREKSRTLGFRIVVE